MTNPAAQGAMPTVSPGSDQFTIVSLLRRKGFVIAVLVGLIDFWTTRFVIFSDGVSYLEIARRYASGNWKLAINAYWSPFYSWVLAIARLLTRSNDRSELISLHFVNLLAYILSLVVFERLLSYLWPYCSSYRSATQCMCFRICAYCLFLWTTLHMIGILYVSPDMLVLLLNLLAAVLLLKIRKQPDNHLLLAQLAVTLAISYLCKAAMLPISLVYFAIALFVRRRPLTFSPVIALLLPFIVLCAPWLIMLHHHQGYWTFGESGKLNYAWEVDGAARSIHWQGEPGTIGKPLHPTRLIFSHPDVYEFGSAIDATYPPWFDPAYWYAGIHPDFQIRSQLKTLAIYLRYVAVLLCLMPGCLLTVLIVVFTADRNSFIDSWRRLWFLLLPSVLTILMYCFVYVDTRYIAGPVLIIGLVVLRSGLPLLKTKTQFDLVILSACGVCMAFVGIALASRGLNLRSDPEGPAATNHQELIAHEVQALGLKQNDRIAYFGLSMGAYWALLDGLKITAEIPVKFPRNSGLNRYVYTDCGNIYEFWNADASTKDRIYTLLKQSGIRAIAADVVPEGADTTGWIKLRGRVPVNNSLVHPYIKLL